MPRFHRTAHRVSLTAMFASMTLLVLFLASILPTLRLSMFFLSSVFVMGLLIEEEIGLAMLMFAAVSLLSLLLMPIPRVMYYVLFFGHYGIAKHLIETRVKDKVIAFVIKLIYYNVAMALIYLLARQAVIEDILSSGWGLAVIIIVAEAAFLLYDFVFTKVTKYYINNIRRLLMKN
ncbi:MAG: hypothetical protein WDA65_05380 [Christensenellales bacterium]